MNPLLAALIQVLGKWLLDWLTSLFEKSSKTSTDPNVIMDKMIANARGYPMRRMLLVRAKRAGIVAFSQGVPLDGEDLKELKTMSTNTKDFE